MQSSSADPISPSFLSAFQANAVDGILSVARFVELALYDPECGYYRRKHNRVGLNSDADFYTATSIKDVFANLVLNSAIHLLRQHGCDPETFAFFEIGAEPDAEIFRAFQEKPFSECISLRVGSDLNLPPRAIVFSNELFDAQPFQRFIWQNGRYRPMGVQLRNGSFSFIELPEPQATAFESTIDSLPPAPTEGYLLDLPTGSRGLLQNFASAKWNGLFIAFDYGLHAQSLFQERPAGTARTYSKHRVSSDFLQRPSEIDITHHVLWDDFSTLLTSHSFKDFRLQSQESFFMKNAMDFISPIVSATSLSISPQKQALVQLLHPHHMGAAFQVASAVRFA